MRLLLKIFAAAIACAMFELPAVDFYDLHSPGFWRPAGEKVIFDFDKITVNGKTSIRSTYPIKIDPGKTYDLKLTLTGNEFEDTHAFVGFDPCDSKGASIPAYCWQSYNRTFTQVTRPAKKGAYSFFVKNAANWIKGIYTCVVSNAKKDFSDIPNKNLVGQAVTAVRKHKSDWEIMLRDPLKSNLAVNTNVREHVHGGYAYLGGANIKIPASGVVNINKKIKGYAPFGPYSSKGWPRNMKYAYLILLIDWRETETQTIISNGSITVE